MIANGGSGRGGSEEAGMWVVDGRGIVRQGRTLRIEIVVRSFFRRYEYHYGNLQTIEKK